MDATKFSLADARECCEVSCQAYCLTPDLQTALAHVRFSLCRGLVIIAFRGTAEPVDFVTDASAWREVVRCELLEQAGMGPVGIHAGFKHAFLSVYQELLDYWVGRRGDGVLLTGHSLGGALATLCAGAFQLEGIPVKGVYTFGCPRIGDADFAREYNSLLGDRTFRFVNEEDIVPRLPGALLGYRHVGTEIFFDSICRTHINPPLWWKLISDAWGTYHDWQHGRIAQLSDHHISQYQQRVASAVIPADLRPQF